jgi:hypothetical protein
MRPIAGLLSALPLLALAGCGDMFGGKDSKNPGDPIGTYALTASVDDNSTCAELAASAPRPWDFSISLRHTGSTGYFIAGGSPIKGSLDTKTGAFNFQTTQSIYVHDANKAKGLGACTLIRTDTFSGSFAGDPTTDTGKATLKGSLRYGYVVATGSDCRDLVTGGLASADPLAAYDPDPSAYKQAAFTTLPCYVRFDVDGAVSTTE